MSREKLKEMLKSKALQDDFKRLNEVRSLNKIYEVDKDLHSQAPKKKVNNLKDLGYFMVNILITIIIVAIIWIIVKNLII